MSEGADSFHFPELSPWSEGHILGRGRFAHCLFSSPSLLLLYTLSATFSVLLPPLLQPLIDWLIFVYEKSIRQPFECSSHWFYMDCSYCSSRLFIPCRLFHDSASEHKGTVNINEWRRRRRRQGLFFIFAWWSQVELVCTIHLRSEMLSNFYDMGIKVTCCLQAWTKRARALRFYLNCTTPLNTKHCNVLNIF